MSVDKCNSKIRAKQDISWDSLAQEAESQIKAHQKKINDLRKSLKVFRKEKSRGVPLPDFSETT